jgi:uncharacterized membrane protein
VLAACAVDSADPQATPPPAGNQRIQIYLRQKAKQEGVMGSITAVTFDDMEQAPRLRETLKDLEHEGLLSLDDMAVIVRDEHGKFKVHGQADRGVKSGALAGGAIGLLLGSIFFPIGGIVLGALAGAGIGASANIGIDKKFVQDIKETMANGSSAIIVYARSADPNAVRAALEPYHGHIIQTTLESDAEETLRRQLEK